MYTVQRLFEVDVLVVVDGNSGPRSRPGFEEGDDAEEGPVAALPGAVEVPGVVGDGDADPLAGEGLPDRLLQGVELAVGEDLGLLEVGEREAGRLEDGVMGVVKCPVVEADAVFGGDPVVEGGTGERGQDEELGRGQPRPLGEADRLADRLPVVLVEAEDEHTVDMDAGGAGGLYGLGALGPGRV